MKAIVVPLALQLVGVPLSAAPRVPKIFQLYTTAETTTSALVVWNTDIASDSLVQYSTSSPIPPDAPKIYRSTPVTVHEIELSGLTPGTFYYFRVTSCARKGCSLPATGSFDTFPSCPDEVPPVSGSWQKVNSPNVGGPTPVSNELLGIAAVSENDAWAVGWSQDPDGPPYVKRSLIQHFDGSTWSIVPSPNRENHYFNVLNAVSGTSANDVWAVGVSHDGTAPSRTLIEHWDGTQWSIVSSPSPDTQLNDLLGVAALAANDVWAVGYRGGTHNETPLETLILHWDGTSWSQVATPNVPGGANQLFGITAISANDIWAVGFGAGGPLALHWDGSAWSVVYVMPNGGLVSEVLTAVAGVAGNDVWAVGRGKGFFSNRSSATLRHWDGVHWTDKVCRATSSSNPPDGYEGGGPDSYFTGISAAAGNDVWAVGVVGSGPYIFHWDGLAWTMVTHPRAFPNSAVLNGVAALTGGGAWSVGFEIVFHPDGSVEPDRTLIDRYLP